MHRRHMPDLSPMYAIALSAGVLSFVASVGLFTESLTVEQVVAIACILTLGLVLMAAVATRDRR